MSTISHKFKKIILVLSTLNNSGSNLRPSGCHLTLTEGRKFIILPFNLINPMKDGTLC